MANKKRPSLRGRDKALFIGILKDPQTGAKSRGLFFGNRKRGSSGLLYNRGKGEKSPGSYFFNAVITLSAFPTELSLGGQTRSYPKVGTPLLETVFAVIGFASVPGFGRDGEPFTTSAALCPTIVVPARAMMYWIILVICSGVSRAPSGKTALIEMRIAERIGVRMKPINFLPSVVLIQSDIVNLLCYDALN